MFTRNCIRVSNVVKITVPARSVYFRKSNFYDNADEGSEREYKDITKTDEIIVGSKKLRKQLQQHVGNRQYWLNHKEQLQDINKERASSQDVLPLRRLSDSLVEIIIPLGTSSEEREKYSNFYGAVRFGKLLEDMDILAGWVGFKYFKGSKERAPFSLVTACVDQINMKDSVIDPRLDLRLLGFVSWAGSTSLEITIHIDQVQEDESWKRLSESVFVMVARSLQDGSACFVNKMETVTEEEKDYFRKGERNKIMRIRKKEESLFKISPTAEERDVIHQLFLKTLNPKKSTFHSRLKPENTVWMEQTRLKNLIICHPQKRNLYNKIFGGFLMREAFELAWANSCMYMKSRPTVVCMDDIIFQKPVEVGSLLYLSSQIVFTKDRYLQVRVHAEVAQPRTGYVDTTNIFHFHFTSDIDFPQVMPMTYGEYMLYLDGRRHCPDFISNS